MGRLWTARARSGAATLVAAIAMVGLATGVQVRGQRGTPALSLAELERGEQVFLRICVACHGDEGDAVPGVNISRGPLRRPYSDAELIRIVRNGIPGTAMPRQNLSDEQAELVVGYLRWLMEPAGADAPVAGTTER